MEFISNKLRQIIKDPPVWCQSKQTILGTAEVAWDHYNATEATLDVIQVNLIVSSLERKEHNY